MKAITWVLLIGVIGAPLLLSLWLIFPVTAGIAVVLLGTGRGPNWLKKVFTPVLYLLLLGFVAWLAFRPWKHPSVASVSASSVAHVLAPTRVSAPDPSADELAVQRRTLSRELAVTRFKIQKISTAIDTVRSAESVFVSLSIKAQPDKGGLGPALEDVRTALAAAKPEGMAGNLLLPGVLKSVVQSLAEDVQAIEVEQRNPALSRDQLIALQDKLPGLLNRRGVDPLPTKLVRLENAVRQTLDAKLESTTTFVARYDRSEHLFSHEDKLIYEQETALRLNGSRAKSLDLSNFFSGPEQDVSETITFQENGGAAREVLGKEAVKVLALDTNFVVVKSATTRANASYPILQGRYFLSFRAIDVHWPNPSFPTVIVNIRLPDNPDNTWPWTVDTGAGSEFKGVELPHDSFIYSTPSGTPVEQTAYSLVTFKDEKVTPQNLATNSHVVIELLPPWLSFGPVQEKKAYLVTENAWIALGMAALSGLIAFIVERVNPEAMKTEH